MSYKQADHRDTEDYYSQVPMLQVEDDNPWIIPQGIKSSQIRSKKMYDYVFTGWTFLKPTMRLSLVGLFIQCTGLGLQICLSVQSLSSFLSSPREARKARRGYVQMMYIILALYIIVTVLDVVNALSVIEALIGRNGGAHFMWIEPASIWAARTCVLGAIQTAGDGLMVWRCYIVWSVKRWVVIFPLIAYLASLSLGIVYISEAYPGMSSESPSDTYNFVAAYFSSVALVSVLTTSLIAFRLIRMKWKIRNVASVSSGISSAYNRALVLVIESALPFTTFGILAAVCAAGARESDILAQAFFLIAPIWIWTCALAPQLIIYRVTTGRSWVTDPATSNSSDRLQTLVFGQTSSNLDKTTIGTVSSIGKV
ncbi:hypothetical protein FA15DRAFT_704665 [Coprinopsis marcescibilis]|uniref:G-protein coupled receptors family 1 profile domain-containing protein n=1 Tax=Coprinopsis marcescibilis TaxID=230819 RepID=A0A5C3KV59_COPMA|nr:hypothetical protein FA15DRAFT_704665 [Coprinopsis marcescibilis]